MNASNWRPDPVSGVRGGSPRDAPFNKDQTD